MTLNWNFSPSNIGSWIFIDLRDFLIFMLVARSLDRRFQSVGKYAFKQKRKHHIEPAMQFLHLNWKVV